MRALVLASLLLAAPIAAPVAAFAEGLVQVPSSHSVAQTMDALEAAVSAAGIGVAARVDHSAGAAKVGLDLRPEQVLIFGNPKIGTPAMQADPLAGLFLPLRVLVYEDAAGKVWLAYQDPAGMLAGTAVPADADYIKTMGGALAKLTAAAAGN